MHLASACDLIFADNRNVVLRLASNRANTAADAGVEIDDHAPGVAVVFDLRIKRFVFTRRWLFGFGDGSDAHQIAAFHLPMMLRGDQFVALAGLLDLQTGAAPGASEVRKA